MEDIHFTIITTTYNREELIMRTINSVLDQTYTNWDMIIVKDNPNLSYKNVKDYIKNKSNITFLENKKNLGNNGSKNIALDNISNKANFVVYLDDDDWLDKGALSQAKIIISENPEIGWFVSNRSLKNNKPITKNLKRKEKINYITDVLILKRFIGDATHFIDIKKWGGVRYSKYVKFTEEWFYFSQIKENFFYYNFNSTYQDSHNEENMTTFYNKNKRTKLKNTFLLWKELNKIKGIDLKIYFFYLPLRIFAILFKN